MFNPMSFFGGFSPYTNSMSEEQKMAMMQQGMWQLAANLMIAGGQGMSTGEGLGGSLINTMNSMSKYGKEVDDWWSKGAKDKREDERLLLTREQMQNNKSYQDEQLKNATEEARLTAAYRQAMINAQNKQLGITFDDFKSMTPEEQALFGQYHQAQSKSSDVWGMGGPWAESTEGSPAQYGKVPAEAAKFKPAYEKAKEGGYKGSFHQFYWEEIEDGMTPGLQVPDSGPGVIDTIGGWFSDTFSGGSGNASPAPELTAVQKDPGNWLAQYNAGVFADKPRTELLADLEKVMAEMGFAARTTDVYQKLNQLRQQLKATR